MRKSKVIISLILVLCFSVVGFFVPISATANATVAPRYVGVSGNEAIINDLGSNFSLILTIDLRAGLHCVSKNYRTAK